MLYWKIKISHKKMLDIKEQLILQIVPRQIHSWWLGHHISEKEAAVASCLLATIYQRLMTCDIVTRSPSLWMCWD